MFISMIAMAIVLGAAYIAQSLDALWYMIAIEFVVVVLVYYLMNRAIRNRQLIRHYHDLFSYGKKRAGDEA